MATMMQIFAKEIAREAENNPSIIGLSADVKRSTGLGALAEKFPERYFEIGISEQNMIGVATGMALEGKTVVTSTYACFSPGRTWEQIRNCVCYQNADVKIIGAHIGVGSGRDGATHQCFEDIALMTVLPNIEVYSPATEEEVKLVAEISLRNKKPTYIRLSARMCGTSTEYKPNINGVAKLKEGKDFAIIGTGSILSHALIAVKDFEKQTGQSVAVYNVVKLNPLNTEEIKKYLSKHRAIISIEEHQLNGGFGSAIASIVVEDKSMPPLHRIGANGLFGASMDIDDLYSELGLSSNDILNKLVEVADGRAKN